jgi:hypothetical protein
MSNISEALQSLTIEAQLNDHYQQQYKPRNYLGLSQIGHHCPVWLWLTYNKYPQPIPDGKLLRLFDHGNLVEDWIIKDLKKLGMNVISNQKEIMFEHNGIKLYGHIDGVISGLKENSKIHLLECKSCNDKKFNELLKLSSYEQWNEQYKVQVHVYMLGLELDRCLAVVYNKNDSRIYSERIKLDKEFAVRKLENVFRIISGERPERKCPRADWYEAKWCQYYGECFK